MRFNFIDGINEKTHSFFIFIKINIKVISSFFSLSVCFVWSSIQYHWFIQFYSASLIHSLIYSFTQFIHSWILIFIIITSTSKVFLIIRNGIFSFYLTQTLTFDQFVVVTFIIKMILKRTFSKITKMNVILYGFILLIYFYFTFYFLGQNFCYLLWCFFTFCYLLMENFFFVCNIIFIRKFYSICFYCEFNWINSVLLCLVIHTIILKCRI